MYRDTRRGSAASGTLECASVVNVPTSVELGTSYFHASPAPMFSEDVSNTPLTYSARSLGNAACGETSAWAFMFLATVQYQTGPSHTYSSAASRLGLSTK